MLYFVSIAIDGRISIPVNANTAEEAKAEAESKFMFDAKLGDIECISFKSVNAEDANGNLTDF